MTTQTCESIQEEISAALDEGRKLSAATVKHATHCAECSAFLELWTGPAVGLLERPLPNAGIGLRETILALPVTVANTLPAERAMTTKRNYRSYVSAAAAALTFGILGYSLIDVQPAGPHANHEFPTGKAGRLREMVALKSDFRKGVMALRQPTNAVQRVLGR